MTLTNNKQIKQAYQNYLNSNATALHKVYKNWSSKKDDAWQYCEPIKEKYNGKDMKIVGYNDNYFSVGFIGKIDNKLAFIYITASYDRYMFLK